MGRFVKLSLEDFAELVERFDWADGRQIDAVHMHHTWRPDHSQWRGEASVESMWLVHTKENGWSDIAQHLTIAPDGSLWTGRDWRLPPASAKGHNGNDRSGPFMFEIVGNFDRGCDRLAGPQREAVIEVIARLQDRHGLPPESLRFHRTMSTKTCPGSGVDYDEICREVTRRRETLATSAGGGGQRGWAPRAAFRIPAAVEEVLSAWRATRAVGLDGGGEELPENDMPAAQAMRLGGERGTTAPAPVRAGRAAAGRALPPDALTELRAHVVNLNQGAFSSDGLFRTAASDVDAIFDDHLERAARQASPDSPLRLLLWAHGGLVDEASGLTIAHNQVKWWLANGVYPLHFVWETGFADALRQILGGARGVAARALARDAFDYTTDPAVEAAVRGLGGGKIWAAMKRSAELASGRGGGARYVAQKLGAFCRAHPNVRLFAVGHSAGSIFHAHFLPVAFDQGGVPPLEALYLLAPAIRVDSFKDLLLARVPAQVRKVVMFTMQRDWEEADSVYVYQKSLLYLIRYALEAERDAAILGLDECVRADAELATLFGLRGAASDFGEIVWAKSEVANGPRASTSTRHGDFDDDPPTMNSLAARTAPGQTLTGFRVAGAGRGVDLWQPLGAAAPPPVQPAMAPTGPVSPLPATGARRALCVGIDKYEGQPLAGCVADAQLWQKTLETLGFQVTTLHDEKATHANILAELRRLVSAGRSGDVLVFQYAGHGTEVEDLDGDETGGTNGSRDEALCPYDSIASGAFLIDDEIAKLLAEALAAGVNLTCFMDCCHSGTNTRFLIGPPPPAARGRGVDRRARFLRITPELARAHRAFRSALPPAPAVRGRSPEQMRQVVFSACRDSEVAYESDGHGEFTLRATAALPVAVGSSHDAFLAKVLEGFGPSPQQHPELDCADASRTLGLLTPFA